MVFFGKAPKKIRTVRHRTPPGPLGSDFEDPGGQPPEEFHAKLSARVRSMFLTFFNLFFVFFEIFAVKSNSVAAPPR
jgi:hypothetical protein